MHTAAFHSGLTCFEDQKELHRHYYRAAILAKLLRTIYFNILFFFSHCITLADLEFTMWRSVVSTPGNLHPLGPRLGLQASATVPGTRNSTTASA